MSGDTGQRVLTKSAWGHTGGVWYKVVRVRRFEAMRKEPTSPGIKFWYMIMHRG